MSAQAIACAGLRLVDFHKAVGPSRALASPHDGPGLAAKVTIPWVFACDDHYLLGWRDALSTSFCGNRLFSR
jgi:hypothetical protein